jgi:hypothetical protein
MRAISRDRKKQVSSFGTRPSFCQCFDVIPDTLFKYWIQSMSSRLQRHTSLVQNHPKQENFLFWMILFFLILAVVKAISRTEWQCVCGKKYKREADLRSHKHASPTCNSYRARAQVQHIQIVHLTI